MSKFKVGDIIVSEMLGKSFLTAPAYKIIRLLSHNETKVVVESLKTKEHYIISTKGRRLAKPEEMI